MEEEDLLHLTLPDAILWSIFCHKSLQKGSVCIFVRKTCISTKLFHVTKEKDLEIFAVDLETKSSKLIVLSLDRTPTGDFNQFIKN
jgi:hypothetical protein